MHFQHPTILLLLWILPGVAALLVYARLKCAAAARQFLQDPMIVRLMPKLHGPRAWIRGALVVLGLALLIVAAARPRFGVYFEKVVQRGVDCFVLLDVSRSMLAEDVTPNRLERAKSDIRDLLKKLGGDRVGLIVFAGKPVLKVPLTTDDGFFRFVLDDVDTHSAPRGGTLIGVAIRKALDAMPPRGDHDQVIVLLTDGEDQESDPIEAAKAAAKRGIKIFTVGLGDSAEGARIPIHDAASKIQYVKEEGKEHWSKADQDVLKQIALSTDGAHIPAGTRSYDLGQIYEDRLAGLARGTDGQDVKRKQYHDRYQWFLALAVVLLAVEMLIPPYAKTRPSRVPGAAAPLLAVVCMFGSPLICATPAQAASRDAAAKVAEGIGEFRGGDFKAATEAFSEAEKSSPKEPRIAFDRGCAYAAQGENEKAAEQFLAAAAAPSRRLATAAHYNLGCLDIAKAKTRFGEHPEQAAPEVRKEGVETLLQAAGHLRDCLAIDPNHADARYNLESIRLWIKHIQDVWRQLDREKSRKEMSLLEFLQMLEGKQRELRTDGRAMAGVPDSPRQREVLRAAETAQRSLAEEIEPLKEKLHAALTAAAAKPVAAGAAPPAPDPNVQKALPLLDGLADDIRGAMSSAADSLEAGKPADAVKSQTDAVEKLDNVFMAVAPFVTLVQKGIAAQEGLIGESKQETISTKDAKGTKDTAKLRVEKEDQKGEKREEVDWREAAWNQRFISGYGRILAAKAQRELDQLANARAAPSVSPAPKGGAPQSAQPSAEQQKELKRALQAGVDVAPKVETLSDRAAAALDAAKPADALPPQEEALKLLKEMLPKQDQQKNDQDKKDRDKKDQEKKDKDKKDQEKKDQQKKEHDKKNRQEKDEKKDQQQKEAGQQKQDLSKQQAEADLRRARQRQQQRRELERALQEYLYRPDKVDKDW